MLCYGSTEIPSCTTWKIQICSNERPYWKETMCRIPEDSKYNKWQISNIDSNKRSLVHLKKFRIRNSHWNSFTEHLIQEPVVRSTNVPKSYRVIGMRFTVPVDSTVWSYSVHVYQFHRTYLPLNGWTRLLAGTWLARLHHRTTEHHVCESVLITTT